MKIYKNLYVGQDAAGEKRKIIKDLKSKKLHLGVYIICLATCEKNLLDIYPSFMMYREDIYKKEILGIALGIDEAYEVCRDIVMDVYDKTKGFDVKGYFL